PTADRGPPPRHPEPDRPKSASIPPARPRGSTARGTATLSRWRSRGGGQRVLEGLAECAELAVEEVGAAVDRDELLRLRPVGKFRLEERQRTDVVAGSLEDQL